MDESKLKYYLEDSIDNSIGYMDTETAEARKQAIRYYNREKYGNEVEGRSQIVTGETSEVVDACMAQVMRVFVASDEIVRFEPVSPGDEEKAEQATDYCNFIFYKDNDGVLILHDWIKDALLQKNGIVKVYWDDEIKVDVEKYVNLGQQELEFIRNDPDVEIVSEKDRIVRTETNADGFEIPVINYDVTVRKIKSRGKVKIENCPPEEFLISKKAKNIEESPFVAHRRLITRSELIAMGFDKEQVSELPTYSDLEYTQERVARYTNGEQPDDDSPDPSMAEIEVFECYIRADMDEDGIAELLRVMYAGKQVLSVEDADFIPFCSLCPIPLPHKFIGQSLADRTLDLQLIKSTITRQILDNIYLVNSPRMAAIEGAVNLDDLLTVAPGGVVRMKTANAAQPLNIPPVANQAFPLLQYLDSIQEKRTGVTMAGQGLDPNILQNTTATAIAAMQNAANGRMELITRIFAETGVKDLFKKILQLVTKYQDVQRIIRLRGKYVPIDPREWKNQFDISINVGLGTGNKQEQIAMTAAILDKQEKIIGAYGINNPFVSPTQYRETLGRFVESAGFVDSNEFFKEITPELEAMLAQPRQSPPDPTIQALVAQSQAKIAQDQAKAQNDIAVQQKKAEADIQLQREKAQADIQLAREKAEASIQLKLAELQAEAQIKSSKVQAGIESDPRIPNA